MASGRTTHSSEGVARGERDARRRYFELVSQRPDAFRNPHPEGIEILLEPSALCEAERIIASRLRAARLNEDWSKAGLYYEDPWLWLVRDVTRFPDGSFHTYHRVILKGGEFGVVMIPILERKIVLIEHYRNGLRDWSLEFPRGGPDLDKTPKTLAQAELREEIGATVRRLDYIANYASNTGVFTVRMNVFVAYLSDIGATNAAEGIRKTVCISPPRMEELIREGAIVDANTIAAFQLGRLHGVI